MADLNHEIQRILSSELTHKVAESIQASEKEIHLIQTSLQFKKHQASELQKKLNEEMNSINSILQENQKLRRNSRKYGDEVFKLKKQFEEFKTTCLAQLQQYCNKCSNEARELKQYQASRIKSSQSRHKGNLSNGSISTQTQGPIVEDKAVQSKTDCSGPLLQKIGRLEARIDQLEREKWQLEKIVKGRESQNNQEADIQWTEQYEEDHTQQMWKESRNQVLEGGKLNIDKLKEVEYMGQIMNGLKHGIGTCKYQGGFTYKGAFIQNKREGLGTLFDGEKVLYKGYWRGNFFNGKGDLFITANEAVHKYIGSFSEGRLHGLGTIELKTGQKIRTEWVNDATIGNQLIELDMNAVYSRFPLSALNFKPDDDCSF